MKRSLHPGRRDYNKGMEYSPGKLLFVSWIIPPVVSGSGYITHQLSKHFSSNDIIIAGGTDEVFKGVIEYDQVKYHRFFTEIHWRGHGHRYFLIGRLLLFPFLIFSLMRLVKRERPELVLATFPDGYYFIASWMISRIFKIKFYSYFHNSYVEARTGFHKWIAQKIQNQVFKDSETIFAISDGLCDYYKNHYPNYKHKFVTLPHTFEQYPPSVSKSEENTARAPYKLVLIGTLNSSNMESTARLFQILSKFKEKYSIDIYSPSNKQVLKLKWGLDTDQLGVRHCGFVKQEDVHSVLITYDACLLTHGFTGGYTDLEYQTIFPTRTIPLLLSGKPIFAHLPEDSFVSQFIKKYDCAELITEKSEAAILKGLERITIDKNRIQELNRNARIASQVFYGPVVYNVLRKQIYKEWL